MSMSPTMDITGHSFEPPRNVQFSVFLDNRVGKLRELIETFQGHAVRVVAFTVLDSTDHAVIRLLTSRAELSRRLLQRNNLPFSEADVLVVEVDEKHSFASLCASLLQAELNIHFAYPLLVRPRGKPAVTIQTDDHHLACHILRKRLFTLLAENDLGENALRDDDGPDACAG